jgi:hypothetical protein
MLLGNKGEWSEIYAFLRILETGKLEAADEKLNKLGIHYPVLEVLRNSASVDLSYVVGKSIEVYDKGKLLAKIDSKEVKQRADDLFENIESVHETSAFEIPNYYPLFSELHIDRLKAKSNEKADIIIKLHDINTGVEPTVGFSIKSELGSPPTLLNAGKTTNFTFSVAIFDEDMVNSLNKIDGVKAKITEFKHTAGKEWIKLVAVDNDTFATNLKLIDWKFEEVLAEMLTDYYSSTTSTCSDLLANVIKLNPLNADENYYIHNFKEFLCATALGLRPASPWKGDDEANGGYIIVKSDGDVVAFHIYNRKEFKDYLLANTKFETASTTRHEFGKFYIDKDSGVGRIKLNLQIRFIK